MDVRTHGETGRSLNELVGDAVRHAVDLVRSEMALLRAELSSNLRQLALALVLIVFAAVFCIIALGLAVDALVAWLTPVLGSEGVAAIVCAAGALVVAVVLFAVGYSRLRIGTLYPDRTADSVRTDVRLIQRRIS